MLLKKYKKYMAILFIVALIMQIGIYPQTVNAEEGDLYNEYKNKLDSVYLFDKHKEFIQKYDYENNYFHCGSFDLICKSISIGYVALIGLIKMMYSGISGLTFEKESIQDNSINKSYKNALRTLSTTMLMIFLMWQSMKIVAVRLADASDGMVAFNDKLLLVFVGGVLLGWYDTFYGMILDYVSMAFTAFIEDPAPMKEVALAVLLMTTSYGYIIALLLVIVIGVFALAFTYRFVLFSFLYIVGVIAIPTIVNDEYNYFSIWLRTLINNGVTLILQGLCFSVGFNQLVDIDQILGEAFGFGKTFLEGCAFFLLALAIPSLLGQLGASSGTTRGVATVTRTIVRTLRR